MEVRSIREAEVDAFLEVLGHAFGFEVKPEHRQHFLNELEFDRLVGAFDGDKAVGTGGAFSFDLTVPGGAVGCGGTTVIAVLPTHRRRGVLTDIMRFHLDEVAGRGEPVAALWASEASIYGRFGYGLASQFLRTKLERSHVSFPRDPLGAGTVRILELAEAEKVLPPLYERVRLRRPGFLTRSESRWQEAHFYDPSEWRHGGTPRRWVLYEEGGEPLGFAAYRQHEKWDNGLAANRVDCGAIVAATPAAEEGLWRYLAGIDLVRDIECWNTDPNTILPSVVADSRRIEQVVSDGMWVRILDVPDALATRRYQVEGRLVLEIADQFRGSAAGTFILEGGPDGATCQRVSQEPDIRLDVRELGAAYLGGFIFSQLARAGLVEGTPEAIRTADLMFGWHLQPWCPEMF